ncbi:MAG: succinate--CoA ligase subunit alpha [Dehalococcoidales bacterium]|nr:succinate--CoA ligase subunit alpha [Dehalococcoidales bacterium]
MRNLLTQDTRVVVQGITGTEGRLQTAAMVRYGTKVVAGVTPGKGGQEVEGVPVYNTMAEAVQLQKANTSIVYVPGAFVGKAAFEAINAGIKTLVIITDGVPQKDSIGFIDHAAKKGVIVVGPNCPGLIDPRLRMKVGIMAGHIYTPGTVGIVSRSGTLTYEISWYITQTGLGQSTCIGIGGDPVVGLDYIQMLEMFRNDPGTKGVILIGEIGGNAEELAADYIKRTKYPKPVVAYIAGRMAPPGKRMGHAGAIIMGNSGTAKSKTAAFNSAGVRVAEKPRDTARIMKELIG